MEITHELLVKVRNEIDRRGHARSVLMNASGAVCLYGGFYAATTGNPLGRMSVEAIRANEEFASTLGFEKNSATNSYGFTATRWNDTPGRTKEEVLALLDEAIARTAPAPEDPLPAAVLEEVLV